VGIAAAGALVVVAALPLAAADPTPTPTPSESTSTTSTSTTTTSTSTTTPAATPAADQCNAAGLTTTISKVNSSMSAYLVAHPEVNQALGDIAKMSPFQAQGALSSFFKEHTADADAIRALQQPLKDLQDQCGFQVTPGQVLIALEDI